MAASIGNGKRLQRGWEAEAASVKKGRGPRQSSVALLADKSIQDNCKTLTPEEIDHIFIGGMSLRQRVRKDKQLKEDKDPAAPKIGKLYWRNLRNKYMHPERIQRQMEPDNSLPLDPKLVAALGACMRGHANRSVLQSYMSQVEYLNQRELVLLLRFLCEVEPSSSGDQLQTCVAVMEGLDRMGCRATYPTEMAVMRPKFDQIATQAWNCVDRVDPPATSGPPAPRSNVPQGSKTSYTCQIGNSEASSAKMQGASPKTCPKLGIPCGWAQL